MSETDAALPPTAPALALDWPAIARGCLIAAAAALLSAAAVFFFAANWFRISGWTKILWVDAALLGLALAAAVAGRGSITRSSFAFAGAMLSGVLFVVHSQVWQSGADPWQLFVVWAVAAALWAAMSEATAVWLLAVILAVLGASLWTLDGRVLKLGETRLELLFPVAVLAVSGVLLRLMRRRWPQQAPGAFLPVTIEVAAMAGLTGLGGLVGVWVTGAWPLAVAAVVLIGGSLGLFRHLAPSPAGYAAAAGGALAFAAALGARLILETNSDSFAVMGMPVLGIALLVGLWRLTQHLRGLEWSTTVPGGSAASSLQGTGVARGAVISAVVGAVAWLAVILLTAAFAGLVRDETMFVSAIAATAAAFFFRNGEDFARRVGGPFAVVAVVLLAAAASNLLDGSGSRGLGFGPRVALVGAAVAGTLAAAVLTRFVLIVGGGLDAGFALAAGLAGLWLAVVTQWAAPALPLTVPVLAGLGWLALRQQAPVFVGAGAALLGAAFFAPSLFESVPELRFVGDVWQRLAAVISAGALVVAAAHGAGWRLDLRIRAMIGGALAVCLVLPGGAAGTIGLFAIAARRNNLGLLAFALALGVWSIGRFYYALELPLAHKAALMAVGGVLALGAWAVLAPRLSAGRFRPPVRALAGFAAIALAVAAAEAQDGLRKAAVVRDGTRILLPMAPVDPRSLVQGDYMAIGYRRELGEQLVGLGSSAILTLDEAGVVRSARRDDGSPKPNEVRAKVHGSAEKPRVAPTSFLFEEGTADTWSKAILVEARVKDGALVMTGLTDAAGKRLEPPPRP